MAKYSISHNVFVVIILVVFPGFSVSKHIRNSTLDLSTTTSPSHNSQNQILSDLMGLIGRRLGDTASFSDAVTTGEDNNKNFTSNTKWEILSSDDSKPIAIRSNNTLTNTTGSHTAKPLFNDPIHLSEYIFIVIFLVFTMAILLKYSLDKYKSQKDRDSRTLVDAYYADILQEAFSVSSLEQQQDDTVWDMRWRNHIPYTTT